MSKLTIHMMILALCGLCLAGCTDMFYREVDFKVEGQEEQLVVQTMLTVDSSVYARLRHTFVLDPKQKAQGTGEVKGAQVDFRINSGEWTTLLASGDTSLYTHISAAATAPKLKALDTVEIRASHPLYDSVSAQQIMPDSVSVRVKSCSIDQRNAWVMLTLHLDPYRGNPTDVVGIAVHSGEVIMTEPSTNSTQHFPICAVYSTDARFAQVPNLSAETYYGGLTAAVKDKTTYCPLLLTTEAIGEGLDIQLLLDARIADKYNQLSGYQLSLSEDTKIGIYTYTREACQYQQFKRNTLSLQLPAPSSLPGKEENYMDAVLQALSYMLGEQEAISAYSNINGGLGYFTAQAINEITITTDD